MGEKGYRVTVGSLLGERVGVGLAGRAAQIRPGRLCPGSRL